MSLRRQRLADEIRDLVANCFLGGKLQDPRLQGITITEVKLSGDLQIASVYFRVFDDIPVPSALKGLQSVNGLLRKQLASNLDVRRVPELRFFYDESIDRAARIEELLNQIK